MFAEILRSKKNTPTKKVREYLQIIEGESERLTRLINNVLDFSKLERGVKEYHFSEFELNELVSSVLKSLSYQFKMEKFRVQVHLSKNENIVCGDVDVVTEALTNLLSNAMKYSVDRKHIEVSTFRKKGFMGISVGDKGIGIAADELRDIFEPFYRAKDEKARQLGGAGLGLSIVRQIMNAHHGKVEVSSLPGRGSKFTLLFPAEAHHETNSYN
jgi:two-component system phosphate regulon sensor histidine kinase PhoR